MTEMSLRRAIKEDIEGALCDLSQLGLSILAAADARAAELHQRLGKSTRIPSPRL